MKKLLAILLSLLLLLVPAFALGEEGETVLTGDWYTEVNGMIVQFTLNADGTYAVAIPTQPDATVTGAWTEKDGFLYFDGNELPEINVLGADVMKWIDFDAFLRREAPAVYTPAEPLADAPAELYRGYWKALYVEVNGAMLLGDTLGAPTAALIDGTTVALIGPLTGETVLETAYENGALTWTEGDVTITLALQQDSLLRMTLTVPKPAAEAAPAETAEATEPAADTVTLYLMQPYLEGVGPVPEA